MEFFVFGGKEHSKLQTIIRVVQPSKWMKTHQIQKIGLSKWQIDDVLQGDFNINTQGDLYTTNAGGLALTSHEICAILDFLEKTITRCLGTTKEQQYGKERKNKWDELCNLV